MRMWRLFWSRLAFALIAIGAIAACESRSFASDRPEALSAHTEKPAKIGRIDFQGTTIARDLSDAAGSFVGKPANTDNLTALANTLLAVYQASDIAIYTLNITDRDSRTGAVRIDVTEGVVKTCTYTGRTHGRGARRVRALAERLKTGRPLRKSILQHILRLIGDVPGERVDADMSGGTSAGALALGFHLSRKTASVSATLNNYGASRLGRTRIGAAISLPNVLAGGDQLDLFATKSLFSNSVLQAGAAYGVPLGTSGLRLSVMGVLVRAHLKDLPISSHADEERVSLNYPLILTANRTLTADLSLDKIDGDTTFSGIGLPPERTRALRLGMNFSDSSARQSTSLAITVSRGLDFAGAKVEKPFSQAVFTKITATASVDRQVGKNIIARFRVSGQYSADALASGESFVVGGNQFGRAFAEAIASGDSGYAGSLEIAWSPWTLKSGQKRVELYGFADGAGVKSNTRYPFPATRQTLASAGLGARVAAGGVNLDLTAAKALKSPYSGSGAGWRLSFGVAMRLDT